MAQVPLVVQEIPQVVPLSLQALLLSQVLEPLEPMALESTALGQQELEEQCLRTVLVLELPPVLVLVLVRAAYHSVLGRADSRCTVQEPHSHTLALASTAQECQAGQGREERQTWGLHLASRRTSASSMPAST
jgi:hypothetical protein